MIRHDQTVGRNGVGNGITGLQAQAPTSSAAGMTQLQVETTTGGFSIEAHR